MTRRTIHPHLFVLLGKLGREVAPHLLDLIRQELKMIPPNFGFCEVDFSKESKAEIKWQLHVGEKPGVKENDEDMALSATHQKGIRLTQEGKLATFTQDGPHWFQEAYDTIMAYSAIESVRAYGIEVEIRPETYIIGSPDEPVTEDILLTTLDSLAEVLSRRRTAGPIRLLLAFDGKFAKGKKQSIARVCQEFCVNS